MKTQTEPLQSICFHECDLVRTAHVVPELKQKRGNTAHPASGHTDQMNAVTLARQKLGKIDFRSARHDWAYFSIVVTTRPAASFGARREEFSDICRSCSGSLDQLSNFPREQFAREIGFLQKNRRLARRKFRHCAFDDRPPRRETESECRATKRRRTRPDWPRRIARPRNRPRCKLLPCDDETRRRGREYFRDDNCRPPDVRPARRKDESPGAAALRKNGSDLIIA